MVEMAGVEPASGSKATRASTSVALAFISHRIQPGQDIPAQSPFDFPGLKEEQPLRQVACFYDTRFFADKHGEEGRAAYLSSECVIIVGNYSRSMFYPGHGPGLASPASSTPVETISSP